MSSCKGTVAGVILAGGLSSRLGREKALLRIGGRGRPNLLQRTHNLLTALLPCCWIACRPGHPLKNYVCIFDQAEGLGPLGGVYAALREAQKQKFSAVLVLPCDLPFMDELTLRVLLNSRENSPENTLLTVYCQQETGFIEALAAVYEVGCIPFFDYSLAQGERQLNRIVPENLQQRIIYNQRDALPFFNVNYPADLAQARKILSS